MKWKAIIGWTLISLVLLFILSTAGGFLYGFGVAISDTEGDADLIFAVVFGTLVFAKVYFMYFLLIFAINFSAIIIWNLLSKKYPAIETGKRHKLIFPLYCIFFGVVFWMTFWLSDSIAGIYAFWGGIFTFLSISLPRLFLKKLAFGAFIGQPNGNEGAAEVKSENE